MNATVFRNVQALRFAAAFLVMLYHFNSFHAGITGRVEWRHLYYFGFFGVEIFFAISGAIMWIATERVYGAPESAKFAYRRLVRIFLPYWFFLTLQYFAASHLTAAPDLQFGPISTILLLPQKSYLLPVAWSLTMELIFYAGFALLILVPKRRAELLACAGLVIILIVATIPLEHIFIFHPPFALTFIGGSFAIILARHLRGRFAGTALTAAFAILIGAVVAQNNGVTLIIPEWLRTLIFGTAACLIVFAMLSLEITGTAIASDMAVRAGDWSYSLYLLQSVVMTAFIPLGGLAIYALPTTLRDITLLGVVCIVVVIAALFSTFIELPVYRWLTRRKGSSLVALREQ